MSTLAISSHFIVWERCVSIQSRETMSAVIIEVTLSQVVADNGKQNVWSEWKTSKAMSSSGTFFSVFLT